MRLWSRVGELTQVVPLTGRLGHRRNDVQSLLRASILPCRDLRRSRDAMEPFSILVGYRTCAVVGCADFTVDV